MVQHKSNGNYRRKKNGEKEEAIFENIMVEDFPESRKDINPWNEESQ